MSYSAHPKGITFNPETLTRYIQGLHHEKRQLESDNVELKKLVEELMLEITEMRQRSKRLKRQRTSSYTSEKSFKRTSVSGSVGSKSVSFVSKSDPSYSVIDDDTSQKVEESTPEIDKELTIVKECTFDDTTEGNKDTQDFTRADSHSKEYKKSQENFNCKSSHKLRQKGRSFSTGEDSVTKPRKIVTQNHLISHHVEANPERSEVTFGANSVASSHRRSDRTDFMFLNPEDKWVDKMQFSKKFNYEQDSPCNLNLKGELENFCKQKSNKSSSIDYQENDYVPVHSVKNSQKSQDRSFRSERRSNEEYKEEPSSVPYTSSDLYLKTSEGRESQHSENLSGCSDTESIVGTKIIPDMGFIANKFEQSRSFCYNYSR
ncbi:unnamed protein product [Moneuplotes crassus]|uniref:Uncharacterized protein n=1 Tax=Euplotes crassus TaxID=5936 RepID=A0AAD1UG39_EUPCR|nr:unnamed protein product [Moneuplotes crassus]